MRRRERIEAVSLDVLARDCLPRARVTIGLAHHPHRIEHDALAANRVEALDIDRNAIRGSEIGEWRGGYIGSAEQHRKVAGHDPRDTVIKRCRPSVEFLTSTLLAPFWITNWGRSTAAGIVIGPTSTAIFAGDVPPDGG